jgi:hypothetical protein
VNNSVTVTVKDIYGTDEPKIPKGYRVVRFGWPKTGELYLPRGERNAVFPSTIDWSRDYHPRLILEKIPLRRWIVEEISEPSKCATPEDKTALLVMDHENTWVRLVEEKRD